MLVILARGSPTSLQAELLTVALQSHPDPYFPRPQWVLRDAWKHLVIPVQGLSRHLMARSRQQEVSPSPTTVGRGEKAAQSEHPES